MEVNGHKTHNESRSHLISVQPAGHPEKANSDHSTDTEHLVIIAASGRRPMAPFTHRITSEEPCQCVGVWERESPSCTRYRCPHVRVQQPASSLSHHPSPSLGLSSPDRGPHCKAQSGTLDHTRPSNSHQVQEAHSESLQPTADSRYSLTKIRKPHFNFHENLPITAWLDKVARKRGQ